LLAAVSAASTAHAQRPQRQRPPNWKPRLGILASYSDANLEFARTEGFTSMQLRLDPAKLDDAAIASIKDKTARAGIYVSSLACDGNHIDPDPAAREKQNQYTMKMIELAGKDRRQALAGASRRNRPRVYGKILSAVREV
jgi:sugar phosphate isomerase/epimerase